MAINKKKTAVISLLLLLLIGLVGFFISGDSFRGSIFESASVDGGKVGVVKAVAGQLKRQPKDSLEFLEAKMNMDLFNEDTVMTGPEDRATVELFDGSVLELDPGSLIRLAFENAAGISGIHRRVLVDIVAGNIKGDMTKPKLVVRRAGKIINNAPLLPPKINESPAPLVQPSEVPSEAAPTPSAEPSPLPSVSPEPSPSPSAAPSPVGLRASDIRITQPAKTGSSFSLPARQSPPLKQPLVFEAPSLADDTELVVALFNSENKELLKKTVKTAKGRGGILANFERPGNYRVEVLNVDGSPIGEGVSSAFKVLPEFGGIEVDAPLVGGEPIKSNEFTGKRLEAFAITLRWKPVDGAKNLRVQVTEAGKRVVDRKVSGTRYLIPKGALSSTNFTYQIRAEFESGYQAISKIEKFAFQFNPPTLALPKNNASVSLRDPEVVKQKGILFSWQRTTFTESYEFEIALDAQFQRIFKKMTLKEHDNFMVFRNLKPATYWWRVKSVSTEMKSTPSFAFKMTVTP